MPKKPLMTHIVAGFPDLETSKSLMYAMDEVGVSFIEIQIPFSDPIADGPTLMNAQKIALENGITTKQAFDLMEEIGKKTNTPLLFMTYFNVIHAYGVESFCQKAASVGAYGLIIPDIPFDEEAHEQYLYFCKKYNLHAIQVVSPLTPESRLKTIAKHASGFVYCVSKKGTTGAQDTLHTNLKTYLETVKKHISIPLALGFGISSQAHVQQALKHADIAVVGSAVINCLEAAPEPKISSVKHFLNTISA